jgi:hypothetical protein
VFAVEANENASLPLLVLHFGAQVGIRFIVDLSNGIKTNEQVNESQRWISESDWVLIEEGRAFRGGWGEYLGRPPREAAQFDPHEVAYFEFAHLEARYEEPDCLLLFLLLWFCRWR